MENKNKIIGCIAVVISLILIIITYFVIQNDNKIIEDVTKENTGLIDYKKEDIKVDENTKYIYIGEVNSCYKESDILDNDDILYKYICRTQECSILDNRSKTKEAIIYDEELLYFNYNNEKLLKININDFDYENDEVEFLNDSLVKIKTEDLYLFDISKNKFVLNDYNDIEIADKYIYTYKTNLSYHTYIYDIDYNLINDYDNYVNKYNEIEFGENKLYEFSNEDITHLFADKDKSIEVSSSISDYEVNDNEIIVIQLNGELKRYDYTLNDVDKELPFDKIYGFIDIKNIKNKNNFYIIAGEKDGYVSIYNSNYKLVKKIGKSNGIYTKFYDNKTNSLAIGLYEDKYSCEEVEDEEIMNYPKWDNLRTYEEKLDECKKTNATIISIYYYNLETKTLIHELFLK